MSKKKRRNSKLREQYVSKRYYQIPNPIKTPLTFYGEYKKPTSFYKNYVVISMVPPNPTINERFNNFCFFRFLKDYLFNPDVNHIFFEKDLKLFIRINRFFSGKLEEILKRYVNYKSIKVATLRKDFLNSYKKIDKKFEYDGVKIKTNYLVDFMMRFYGSFKDITSARKYIESKYAKDYKFGFKIFEIGKWIPILSSNVDKQGSSSLDKSVDSFLKDFHKRQEQTKKEVDLKARGRKKIEEKLLLEKDSELEVYGFFCDAFIKNVSDGFKEETNDNILKQEIYINELEKLVKEKKEELEVLKEREKFSDLEIIDYLDKEMKIINKDIKHLGKDLIRLEKMTKSIIKQRESFVIDLGKVKRFFKCKIMLERRKLIENLEKKIYSLITEIVDNPKDLIKNKNRYKTCKGLLELRLKNLVIFKKIKEPFENKVKQLYDISSKLYQSFEEEPQILYDLLEKLYKLSFITRINIDNEIFFRKKRKEKETNH